MRKTLLIAAAALAAGVISSNAQVYSQNIVGYINVPCPSGFTPVANPLNNASGNNITNVMPNIPDFSFVYRWNGVSYDGYEVYQGAYYDTSGNNQLNPPTINVGNGVFVQAATSFTNTFVGTVLVTNGAAGTITTNNTSMPAGFTLVGGALPIGGGIISNLQMANIPDFSFVYTWVNGGWSGAESYQGTWYDVTGNFTVAEPTVTAGSSFFVNAAAPYVWSMTYTNQ